LKRALVEHATGLAQAFLMHGDNSNHNMTASEGCIVVGVAARVRIAASIDRALTVTA